MESDCKYKQSALLNLTTGYKQNDVVILNPNNYKENMKIHIQIPCTCKFMIHICTDIYALNTGQENFFFIKSFIFNIQNNSFHYIVISIVHGKAFRHKLYFSFLLT